MAKSKKLIYAKKEEISKTNNVGQSGMLFIADARRAFTKLRQVFVEAPILNHFDPEHYIRMEIDVLGYAIGSILSQLILDYSGQWYLVAFFFRKIIPVETWYKIHNGELLAIVKVF